MSTPSTRARGLLAAAVCLVVLAACGDEAGTGSDTEATDVATPTASPTDSPTDSAAAQEPACDEVWVDGSTLPEDYRGCSRDGAWQEPKRTPCSFGVPIVTFDGRFYAVPGQVVNDVGDITSSKAYRQAVNSCQG